MMNRMKNAVAIVAYVAVLFCALITRAEENISAAQAAPDKMAEALGLKLPKSPWHLADIWWEFEKPTEKFECLTVDVTIDRDIPATYNLYVSPVGLGKFNGMQFYGGLQSNINGWENAESRKRVHPGKGAIFSRWSKDKTTPIGLHHVRMASGGLVESAGYEGEFCSVRRAFEWTKGTYTYSIMKGDTETIEGQPHTWFHCSVRSHQTGAITFVGSIRFEGNEFSYWDRHAAFVEVYSTEKIPRSGIPKVTVTFGYPRVNGAMPPLKKGYFFFDPAKSPGCAKVHTDGTSTVIEVGEMFAPTKENSKTVLEFGAKK